MDDDNRPRRRIAHEIGETLDALSIRDFDERIALLRSEIERLEAARRRKQSALDHAGSIFKA